MIPRLQEKYQNEVRPALAEKLEIKNPMAIPKVTKIVINMGVGEAIADKKNLELAFSAMTEISGQRPVQTLARKSIAGFKLREGMPIGCKVTLRRDQMYEFMDRLVTIALPRVRDFRGLSPNGFDRRGNYNMGLREQLIFPEIEYDKIDEIRGMNITICTTAPTDDEARALLAGFKMPFVAQA